MKTIFNKVHFGLRPLILAALLVLTLAPFLTACAPWTVKPINDEGNAGAQSAVPGKPGFNAKAYVDSIWQSQVLTTVQDKAADLPTVLAALKADPEAAKQKYGYRQGQSPYNFLVKGEATVDSVDTTTRTGTLKLTVPQADSSQDVAIQIGPVIRGTALRDAMPFIQFNMFTNQIEYADVSNAMNDRVLKDVVGKLDTASLKGKTVAFQGAFTYNPGATIMIVPVKLDTK
ncbi:MAG TPA: DUF2291 domain-containing protein [Chloroflexia bacterium]|nr:DUF2291 domain-containing protein [Chloroflexia bacterium]